MKTKLSNIAIDALQNLKSGSYTAQQLKELGLETLNSAHLTALVNRGLATTDKVEVEVPTVVKRKVNIYTITEKGIDFKESE